MLRPLARFDHFSRRMAGAAARIDQFLVLGVGLVALARRRALVGWVVAAFFVAVFPGNVSQFVDGDDAFGLTSDLARGVRLLFQPVLVVWALWSTEAWRTWRAGGRTAVLAPQA